MEDVARGVLEDVARGCRPKRARVEHESPVAAATAVVRQALSEASNPVTAAAQSKYMKGAARYYGLHVPQVNTIYRMLCSECEYILRSGAHGEDARSTQRAFVLELLADPFAETKLFAIYYMQGHLLEALAADFALLDSFSPAFDAGHIAEWATCDAFSSKVLSRMLTLMRDTGDRFEVAVRHIAGWQRAPTLWQRRAACVALVPFARHGEANFAGFTSVIVQLCETAVQCQERFAQLGVGWLLRELALADPGAVRAFLAAHRSRLSSEAVRSAREKVKV